MSFDLFELAHGAAVDLFEDPHPTSIVPWNDDWLVLPDFGTHFGIVLRGPTEMICSNGVFRLQAGMYFSLPISARITGGCGLAIMAANHRGLFQIGGPIEEKGRLRYIDGCSDSLLIAPVMMGDPCLNLLHIPPGTRQTTHTHPSLRIGLVMSGAGECITADDCYPLSPGTAFIIHAHAPHCFQTTSDSLRVIAYHPDSDFGPTHECHPMLNRTIIAETTP